MTFYVFILFLVVVLATQLSYSANFEALNLFNQPYPSQSLQSDPNVSHNIWPTQLAQKIRFDLQQTKNLSVNAKNINILVLSNQILLKGRVKNKSEMNQVLKITTQAAPKHEINNELIITK